MLSPTNLSGTSRDSWLSKKPPAANTYEPESPPSVQDKPIISIWHDIISILK